MPEADLDDLLKELAVLVDEEHRVVSYRWLARHFSVPSNLAKRLLFKFTKQHSGQLSTAYLLSGWSKEDGGQQVVRVVRSEELQDAQAQLDPITCMHVYSVAPNTRLDSIALSQPDHMQSHELLKDSLGGSDSASATSFKTNGCSAVRFLAPSRERERKPRTAPMGQSQQAPAQAAPVSAAASLPPKQHGSGGAAKPAASLFKPSTASAAVATAPSAAKDSAAGSGGSAAESAAAGAMRKPGATGKGNALTAMWGKAGAKKTDKAPAGSGKASLPASQEPEDAVAAVVAAAAAVDSPVVKGRRGKGKAVVIDDDSDEEMPDAKAPAARVESPPAAAEGSKTAGAQPKAADAQATVAEGQATVAAEGEPAAEAPKAAIASSKEGPGKGKGGKRKAAATGAEDGETAPRPAKKGKGKATGKGKDTAAPEQEEAATGVAAVEGQDAEAQARPQEAAEAAAAKRFWPATAAKGGEQAPTSVHRKKVLKTTYNDRGEEVTEEVWEEVEGPEPVAAAAPVPAAKPAMKQEAKGSGASTKGSGGAGAGSGKGSGGVGGKGKAAAAAPQKGILSYFNKK